MFLNAINDQESFRSYELISIKNQSSVNNLLVI